MKSAYLKNTIWWNLKETPSYRKNSWSTVCALGESYVLYIEYKKGLCLKKKNCLFCIRKVLSAFIFLLADWSRLGKLIVAFITFNLSGLWGCFTIWLARHPEIKYFKTSIMLYFRVPLTAQNTRLMLKYTLKTQERQ